MSQSRIAPRTSPDPSDTPQPRPRPARPVRRVRLGVLIVIIQTAVLVSLASVMTLVHYQAARSQIAQTLQADFLRMQRVASRLMAEELALLTTSVDLLVHDASFSSAAAQGDWDRAADLLYERVLSSSDQKTDFLLLVDPSGDLKGSVGSPPLPVGLLIESSRPHLNTRSWRLVGDKTTVAARALPVIDQNTGEVVGHVLYGLSLRSNLPLIHGLRQSVGADALLLIAGGLIQASAPLGAWQSGDQSTGPWTWPVGKVFQPDAGHVAFVAPISLSETARLRLVFLNRSEAFQDLLQAYLGKLWVMAALILVGGAVAVVLFSWLVVRPARRMIDQAMAMVAAPGVDPGQESRDTNTPVPTQVQRSPVVEFDAMGQMVSRVFAQLQDSNRTLEAKVQDRTLDLKASETRIRLILETAVDAIITMDAQGRIVSANPTVRSMFGYDPAEVVGRDIALLLPCARQDSSDPATGPQATDQDEAGAQGSFGRLRGGIGTTRELEGRHRLGSLFPVEVSMNETLVGANPLLTAFVRNVTDRKAAERDLVEARHQAEAASAAKTLFLANMSHEIRTPMNAIMGFTELSLMHDGLPDQVRRHLDIAHGSARSLLQIIDDILDVSKLETGNIDLDVLCFSLENTIRRAVQILEPQAQEKGLALTTWIDPALPPCFAGDPARLRQIFINLVGNAVKFTASGSVTLRARATDRPDKIHFEIEDTGIGIPRDRLDSIFDSFTQADQAVTRLYGGTGLGTTISKQLVELMGGSIWVNSVQGQGTTFHFTVQMAHPTCLDGCLSSARPLRLPGTGPAITTDPEVPSDPATGPASAPASHHRLQVLLAEDVPRNAALAVAALTARGYEVQVVDTGRRAVTEARTGTWDVILMDVHMPELDGLSATRAIRAWEMETGRRRLPIYALTASVLKDERESCLEAGMDGMIAKPIVFSELFQTLDRLAEAVRLQAQDAVESGDRESAATQGPEAPLG